MIPKPTASRLAAKPREYLRKLKNGCVVLVLRGALSVALGLATPVSAESTNPIGEKLMHPRFGQIAVVRPAGDAPKGTVLLLAPDATDDTRWQMVANAVAGLNYLVTLADSDRYLEWLAQPVPPCGDVAADLAALGSFIASRNNLPRDQPPMLMGFEQGATLVYAALAQGFPGEFHTAISIDFCPQLRLSEPLCTERGLDSAVTTDGSAVELAPDARLTTDWFVFHGTDRTTCAGAAVSDFFARVPAAKLTELPGAALEDGKLSPQITALLNWLDPSIKAQVQMTPAIADVPLIEARVAGSNPLLAVMLSGDGGWAKLDRSVASEMNKRGISVVGWDTLSYFWEKKTPERAAGDLAKVLRYYLDSWDKRRALLIGYSFGADILPFMLNRVTPELRPNVALAAMLGLTERVAFEFHLSNWLGDAGGGDALPVPPEVAKLDWVGRLCIYGAAEPDSACPGLEKSGVAVVELPGDHHFGGDYRGLTEAILNHLPAGAPQ